MSIQLFGPAGAPLGDARRITDTPAASLVPSIRAWRAGIAPAWNEYKPSPEGAHAETARSQVSLALVP